MKKIFTLLLAVAYAALAMNAANVAAQSGRKNVRPPTQPVPPIQAPVFTPPDPDPRPAPAPTMVRVLPDSLLYRSLRSLNNSSFRLADFSGKVIVVNLWASWCGPCRSEVPEYEKVRKEYAGRDVEFIALTTEDPRTSSERVKKFVSKFNFGFRLGWADRETSETLMNGTRAVPQTLVVAPDGRIVGHWDGYRRGDSGDHLRATIERALLKPLGEEGKRERGEGAIVN